MDCYIGSLGQTYHGVSKLVFGLLSQSGDVRNLQGQETRVEKSDICRRHKWHDIKFPG